MKLKQEVLGYMFLRRELAYYCEALQLTIEADINANSRPWFVAHATRGVFRRSNGLRRQFKTPLGAAEASVRVYRDEIRKSSRCRSRFAELTSAQHGVVDRMRAEYPRRWRRIIQNYWERPGSLSPDLFGDAERSILGELRDSHGMRWLLGVRYT